MAWEPITADADLPRFLAVLLTHPIYAGSTTDGLRRIRAAGGQLWLYTSEGSRSWQIALAVSPHPADADLWVVRCGFPAGDFPPGQAMRTCIRQLRRLLDAAGIERCQATPAADYGDRAINEYMDHVDAMWELTSIEAKQEGRFHRWHWRRTPAGRVNDDTLVRRMLPRPKSLLWNAGRP